MTPSLKIAILIKTDSDWHRSIIRGIAQFAEAHRGWQFTVPNADENGEVRLPPGWRGDGIICRLSSVELASDLLQTGIPAVNVSWLSSHEIMPKVVSDEAACGRMAAEVFAHKQFQNVGYVGAPPGAGYSDTIENSLKSYLSPLGINLHICPLKDHPGDRRGVDPEELASWVRQLSMPTGVIAWSSYVGYQLLQACREVELDVPQDVSILCIEHDNLWAELAPVPLSNLDQDPTRVGYLAARQLHQLIEGASQPAEPLLIQPSSVVHRLSTEASAVEDPLLRLALQYIYDHAKDGMTVNELVSILGVSRRSLESKFKRNLSCTPAAFIRNIQLQAVARLLRTTNLSIVEISKRTGYEYPEVLMRAFKREFHMTPMQFRESGGVRESQSIRGENYSTADLVRPR